MSNELELDQKAIDDLLATANQELTTTAAQSESAASQEPQEPQELQKPANAESVVVPQAEVVIAPKKIADYTFSIKALKQQISKKLLMVIVFLFVFVIAGAGFLGYKVAGHVAENRDPLDKIVNQGITFEGKNFVTFAGRGDKELVMAFLDAGMSVDALRPSDGWSPLMAASFFKKTEIVKLLLENDATVNLRDIYGRTALMQATVMGAEDIVVMLLESGADPNIQDRNGRTALIEAYFKKQAHIAEILKSAGADPNITPPKAPEMPPPPTPVGIKQPLGSVPPPSAADEALLSVGKAGFIKIGMPLTDLKEKYPTLTVSDKYVEGTKRKVATIYLNGQSTPSFQLELSNGALRLVSTISTFDEHFTTEKQISVKSTVNDIRNQYSINDVKVIDNSMFLVVKSVKMLFELDLGKNVVLTEWLNTGNPTSIPADVKIKRIVIY